MDAKKMGWSPIDLRDQIGARIDSYALLGMEPPPKLILAFAQLDVDVKLAEEGLAGAVEAVLWRLAWERSHRRVA